jgi:ferric-dicitrate binding protein FerR (iron transport regulator)
VEKFENDIDDLIGKVLAGEGTTSEREQLEFWCNLHPDNRKYFDQTKTIFNNASTLQVKERFDSDAAWQKVRSQLQHSKKTTPSRTVQLWPALRIAAGLALLVALGYWIYSTTQNVPIVTEVIADKTTAKDTLPDGTTAFLNKKSSITFAVDKKTGTRKVELKGEGFFEVKHEEEKPFVIEAEETIVRDLGTAFNVKAYPDQDTVEVVVQSGVVQFYTAHDPGINLSAGETGLYSKRTKSFTRLMRADTNVFAYKTGVFAFHSTDLRSVVDRINEVYDSQISLGSEKIGDCRLTVNFNNEQLDTIVEVIAETLSLQVERKNQKEIVLKGAGCQ